MRFAGQRPAFCPSVWYVSATPRQLGWRVTRVFAASVPWEWVVVSSPGVDAILVALMLIAPTPWSRTLDATVLEPSGLRETEMTVL